jgi:hypothetical protein
MLSRIQATYQMAPFITCAGSHIRLAAGYPAVSNLAHDVKCPQKKELQNEHKRRR